MRQTIATRTPISALGRRAPSPRTPAPAQRRQPLYIVEARRAGMLVNDAAAQPPYRQATQHQLTSYFLESQGKSPDTYVSWREIREWYESRGWFIRERSW